MRVLGSFSVTDVLHPVATPRHFDNGMCVLCALTDKPPLSQKHSIKSIILLTLELKSGRVSTAQRQQTFVDTVKRFHCYIYQFCTQPHFSTF